MRSWSPRPPDWPAANKQMIARKRDIGVTGREQVGKFTPAQLTGPGQRPRRKVREVGEQAVDTKSGELAHFRSHIAAIVGWEESRFRTERPHVHEQIGRVRIGHQRRGH